MNSKRYFLASFAVFVFIFIFEWVFHGMALKGLYEATASLWRPKEECVTWAMFVAQVMFAFVFTFIFTKGYEGKGIGEGTRYGILIGLLMIPTNLIWYAVAPLPFELVVYWSIGGIIELVLCGAIAATVYKQ